ncbi:acetyl-CoA carboxylase biotin carboxyl carrier protein [Paenibacillus thalictri]|uniref:Biotin carboxyl carrier protein of acetyl-CoA carboxylase n=1 Tax=Paenibacillus thalictri TaxID=2527873 RepID=A0A4Q9DVZ1_9BACL|nr:acetyl-CoA carboxylase biotin carboxyl carrier protein [Paenibacillus thalictri]TBL79878.1 acetyl-CoA carboxylase biotin carboxyl carrier protein [Paenibacillus thalictri]
MFKLSEIKELIKLIDQSSLQELEIESEGSRLSIRKPNKTESVIVAPAAVQHSFSPVTAHPRVELPGADYTQPAAQPAAVKQPVEDASLHKIVSPMVGTFYQAPSPTAPAFVTKGARVNSKSVVCIVEAMKLMNEIEAEINGEIVEILVENGQLVEYGQPLFLVKTE